MSGSAAEDGDHGDRDRVFGTPGDGRVGRSQPAPSVRGDRSPHALRPAPPHLATPSAFVPRRLLVRFKSGVEAERRIALRRRQRVRFDRKLPGPGLELVRLEPGASVADAARALERRPDIAFAEPDFYRHLAGIPNDPRFSELWGLNNTGQFVVPPGAPPTGGTPDADIDAPEAWNLATGSRAVTVAVVDQGIAATHPDLAPNIWRNPGESGAGRETNGIDDDGNGYADDSQGWDFAHGDKDPTEPGVGHGTAVAGEIGARGNDGYGISGLNWNVSLMAAQVFDASGSLTSVSNLIQAYDYAARNGAKVLNASFSGSASSQAESLAISHAGGTLFVAAAGNGGADGIGDNEEVSPDYPCAYDAPNLICVAATDQADRLARFSNYGPTTVDLGPGVNVLSSSPVAADHFGDAITASPAEDFEQGAPGWITSNASPWSATGARAHSGALSATDSVGGSYPNNADSELRSPPMDLGSEHDCRLSFWLDLEMHRGTSLTSMPAPTRSDGQRSSGGPGSTSAGSTR